MTRKKPKLLLISSFVVLGAAFAVILALPDPQHMQQASLAAKPVLTVTATQARVEMLPVRISAHGNIVAWQEASIGAEADGLRLTEVRANVGDSVKKGQLLAGFASATVQAELDLSRAEHSEAEALYAEAKADLKRTTELQNSGALSSQQIQRYITAAQSALARLEAATARVTTQELRLAQTRVLAPDQGIISARTATVGAVLPAGQELFRLIRGGRLEWRAEVSSEDLAKLQPGQTAHLTLADGSRIEGVLRMLSPLVDTQSRNALVYVDLAADASNSSARSGMFASGHFELAATEVITLPQSAVQLRDGFSYVLRIGADSTVIQTKVKTGRRNSDRIEIARGLKLSDQVVATGGAFLGDGDLIKVVDSQPSSTYSLTGHAGGELSPML
ncbi:MAG: efflux RND transporter periplasmic adaptor subunit [Gammaproteobacteria bacterium]|nr:efflux RND transporter periplasmic adaptor subunit [Gammaproteobacteria bacterium]MBU2057130.1 efflux RND transporter periplasmic adaptor subunit [Gammaproteobacteria bacterium]MBU2175019.1 efflux RND transporter periplasmic adaptor subunit [Gammaproteobacteria bacterium]MBU2246218.1 efflux RND transporter periplasmic adaptor subunit [Gammaproteobacteria bacterium]MBU2344608.1 efflux RND transporter periplasmic adaptor subunit [Gammaproteobacteria bacterium]